MNKPYIKKYNADGTVKNPIKGGYLHNEPNRRERRANTGSHKFIGCSKSFPLTVVGKHKYKRFVQNEWDKDGNLKHIYHYLSV